MNSNSVFFLFRETMERLKIVNQPLCDSGPRHMLYAMNDLAERGWSDQSNLDSKYTPGRLARWLWGWADTVYPFLKKVGWNNIYSLFHIHRGYD